MKYIFIINPSAGRGRAAGLWLPKIRKLIEEEGLNGEIHRTISFSETINYIRRRCEEEEELRFYCCGGDGTLNCLIHGVLSYPNAAVGILPAGTGNDFIRNITHNDRCSDLQAQIAGMVHPVDVIRCTGASGTRLAVNMCNIGLDAAVVDETAEMKKCPLLKGSLAYVASLFKVLSQPMGFRMSIETEQGKEPEEEVLLTAVANGGFCGGGFYATPLCRVDDGQMDVCVVRKISRRKLVSVLMKYRNGEHLEDPGCQPYLIYRKCTRLTLTPARESPQQKISIDGEIFPFEPMTFEILPKAVNFILPEGCRFIEGKENKKEREPVS